MALYKIIFSLLIIMGYGVAYAYIPFSEFNGEVLRPNHKIKTQKKIYLGIRTQTCYVNGRKGVYIAGFSSSTKTPVKVYNNTVYVPSLRTVLKHNPAYSAGLRVGDEILEYNEKQVHNERHLTLLIAKSIVGSVAIIKIRRNNQIQLFHLLPEMKKYGINMHDYAVAYKRSCEEL